ncbi:MAG: serine hydrolase domain-containing protein [Pseudomonadota bacterium]
MMKRVLNFLLFVFALTVAFESAFARTEFDSKKIEAWADEYFEAALANKRMNGASVGFIQDGEILFLKAYGWQDQKAQIPLDPEQTRFRMCSTSKTVTATALMQLVERGRIASLDDPVNMYLKRYRLPPPHGDEVTFRQLMTHSSGMAGHFTPQGVKKELAAPVDAKTVQALFRENIERKPGAVGQYANLGVALEGVAIEDITGQSLASYVDENIFEPLGMESALFHHSLEKPPYLAQPYAVYPDGSLQEIKFYPKHPLTAASGGLITTTKDMLKYVALHADEKAQTFPHVLSGEGRKTLHARHFGRHPSDLGMGLHFYRDVYGDELMVHHGCGLPGTRSLMGVFPNSNAGFVVTVLTAGVSPSVGDLLGKLLGRGRLIQSEDGPGGKGASTGALPKALLGDKVLPTVSSNDTSDEMVSDHSTLAGTYWGERRSFGSYAPVFASDTTQVTIGGEEGELLIDGKAFVRRAPGVYDSAEGANRVFFRQVKPDGDIYLHEHVSFSARQTSGLGNPMLSYAGLAVSFVLSLTGVGALAWGRREGLEGYAKQFAVGMTVCVVSITILVFAGYETVWDIAFIDFLNGDVTRVVIIVLLLNIHFLLGVCVVGSAIWAWARSLFGSGAQALVIKSHLSLLALASVAAWPGMFLFNLIGLRH